MLKLDDKVLFFKFLDALFEHQLSRDTKGQACGYHGTFGGFHISIRGGGESGWDLK